MGTPPASDECWIFVINNNLNIPRKVNQTTQVSDYTHIFLGIPRFTPSTRLSTRPPTPRLIESPSMPRSSMRRHTPWLVESPPSPMRQRVSSDHERIIGGHASHNGHDICKKCYNRSLKYRLLFILHYIRSTYLHQTHRHTVILTCSSPTHNTKHHPIVTVTAASSAVAATPGHRHRPTNPPRSSPPSFSLGIIIAKVHFMVHLN